MKSLSLIAALLLAACGSSDGDTNAKAPEQGPAPPIADVFLAQVQTVAATQPEESEAASIDAVTATAPESSEPVALP